MAERESITENSVDARYEQGRKLARSGHFSAALFDFLWCFDDGMTRFAAFGGVRVSFLLREIARLGERYPEALAALRSRRDQAARRMEADSNRANATVDFAAINDALGESQKNVDLYDSLPANSPLRESLFERVYDQLIASKRYLDASQARPTALMFKEHAENVAETMTWTGEQKDLFLGYAVRCAIRDTEVLVGSGDLANARMLIEQLLEFDNSQDSKSRLLFHLSRAGRPDLIQL